MISAWRDGFSQPKLPFYYVLLAAGHTALLRESQMAASKLPNTAFSSALDLGATADEEAHGFQPGAFALFFLSLSSLFSFFSFFLSRFLFFRPFFRSSFVSLLLLFVCFELIFAFRFTYWVSSSL
jgi:predicted neutral ceramidase superfamily lipid hydrolase